MCLYEDDHCFKENSTKKNHWYLDSGCSRHMTRDKNQFMNLKLKSGNNSSIHIENVLLVNGLKYNLFSISQLCDKGHKVIFECMSCQVIDINTNKLILIGHRQGNVYVVYLDDLSSSTVCLMSKNEDESWLWHRRLGHVSMHVIPKLC